jgi:hypothetical protein
MTVKRLITCACAALLLWPILTATAAQKNNSAAYQENRAIILVTGMRLNEDPENYQKDTTTAEAATVRVVARNGAERTKTTTAFARSGGKSDAPLFTADFEVDLDTVYDITMTFKDGTVIRVDDYRLPNSWKTHFYFHGTTGTLSPSSILRFVEDPKTKLRCCIYAVYPLESYRKLGGSQIQ